MGEIIKIDLGGGMNPHEGYVNVDKWEKADFICDFESDPLPFDNDSVDEILARHIFEHIFNLKWIMNECHRVLKPWRLIKITVPRWDHVNAIVNPTHCRFFHPDTFKFFDPELHTNPYGFSPWRLQAVNMTDDEIYCEMAARK
jgi:SAM-dependent methyltransferase